MNAPNLLLYSDYRKYLKDYYATHKAANPNFSYRYMSMKAGINSSAFYKYILDGERNLSKQSILKTCMMLKLKDRDAEYFENLVFFNQAETIKEKNTFFDRLTRLRGDYEKRRVEEAQFAFYGEWHHTAVRELPNCLNYKGDPEGLAELIAPAITPGQVKESMELMIQLGLVHKDAQGRWKQADAVLTTGGQIIAPLVMEFQRKMLRLALEAFDRWTPEERLMSSTTFSISDDTRDLFKRKIRELKSELLELARLDEKPRRVYHLNLNLFPLSRAGEERLK